MSEWSEKDAFLESRRLPPAEREAYLRSVCPDEASVQAVLALLQADAREGAALPGAGIAPEADEPMPEGDVGPYRLLRRLGQGGMGVVYLAEHRTLGKRFALKFLRADAATSARAAARFVDEARITAKLAHPGIVQVVDIGERNGRTWIASEYVDGRTLADLIEERRAADPSDDAAHRAWMRRAAEITGAIAAALDAAHAAGVVHCDVKPANILVDDVHGARLSDFGIARLLNTDAPSGETAAMLTPWYASPEQVAVAVLDRRTDVYSLGAVLYEMLALRRPFEGASLAELLDAIRTADPVDPRRLDRRIPRALETVCLRALEKRPDDRYPSAGFIASEMRAHLEGREIVTPARSPIRRAARFLRRRSRSAAIVAAAALVVGSGWIALRALDLERRQRGSLRIELPDVSAAGAVVRIDRIVDGDRFEEVRTFDAVGEAILELDPGLYRCSVVDRAEPLRFAEIDEWLVAGTRIERTLQLRAAPVGAGTMTVVGDLLVDQTEVTNAAYAAFLVATNAERTHSFADDPRAAADPARWAELPVVGVSRDDMTAYAAWVGARLPTIDEWASIAAQFTPAVAPARPSESMLLARTDADPDRQRDAYFTFARPVVRGEASALDGLADNVSEATGSIEVVGGTTTMVLAGPMWADDPDTFDLARGRSAAPLAPGSPHTGFRCVRRRSPPQISPSP
jgi:tRNA A-37 threonylcarbamoyl transferase component Bud32